MTFLGGWTPIATAAALTIPPLVALYFLKLRRRSLPVSSTLLWKRAVEDLQVNAPFQRIRNNLLLWLQLLVLILAALCLGKPMMQAVKSDKDNLVILIDHSASMNVEEPGGDTRLAIAKNQAKTIIDNMPDGSRAMIIGFADRASIISSFDTDRKILKTRIDELEETESTTTLAEAVSLAEAYMQNLVIAGDAKGTDIEVATSEGPARVVILTDGNVADEDTLTIKRMPVESMEVVSIGERDDNVAIMSMDARRNYERPAALEVFAAVHNFGSTKFAVDANLYINGEHVDVQSMVLEPGRTANTNADADESTDSMSVVNRIRDAAPLPGSVASVAFDEIEYEGGGVVEVRLKVADALESDNKAWTIVRPPRNVSVLLVTPGNVFLDRLMNALPIICKRMSPAEYESASEEDLTFAGRSKYDVVIIENHNTDRLWAGNYIFFGGVPLIEGVSAEGNIEDEVIFNWDESHPILRYVAVETVQVFKWLRLTLPLHAEVLIEGESSPLLAYMSDEGRQFLLCAFGIIAEDEFTGEPMLNTDWVVKAHFPVFISNALQYLAGSLSPKGVRNVQPGEPMEFPVPEGEDTLYVRRPDGREDAVPTAGFNTVNYARTRKVGVYEAKPSIEGHNAYAVNLFSRDESSICPRQTLTLSGAKIESRGGIRRVNKPVWPWLLLSMLGILALEWAIYSKRVYV